MLREYDASTTADELVDKLASEIQGKVVLTTGISPGGIGDTFVSSIARGQPAMLILANRNPSKAQPVADAIKEAHPRVKVRLLALDLISFAAVRKAAATVNSWADVPHLDVVVTNAGIMGVDFKLSPDGFESTLATNHLGHFLFVNLIMPKLLASEAPRVVSVSSDGHRDSPIRWGDYNFSNGETYNKWSAYGQSKTANALMAVSLAKKLGTKNLTAVSLHPGVVMSSHLGDHIDWSVDMETLRAHDRALGNVEGWEDFKYKTPQQGAATHVYAAFEPSLKAHNGAYLQDSHIADPWTETVRPWATDIIEAERLWVLSEKLVGEEFNYSE